MLITRQERIDSMLVKIKEKIKAHKGTLKKVVLWTFLIAFMVSMSGITVYFCGDYWFSKFLKTQYMQEKLWPQVSSMVDRYSFYGISKDEYKRYETDHFIIFYQTEDKALLQKVARAAERIAWPVSEKMRYARTVKTPIVLIPDQEKSDYSQFGGVIRVTEKIVNEEKAKEDEILAHEYTHILIRDLTRDNMLCWLQEGIAEYVEAEVSGKPPYYIDKVEIKEYTYNVRELENNFSAIPSKEGYGQGYLTVKFIVEKYGEIALLNIIDELKDERIKEETAFKKVLGLNYEELHEKLVQFKQEQLN